MAAAAAGSGGSVTNPYDTLRAASPAPASRIPLLAARLASPPPPLSLPPPPAPPAAALAAIKRKVAAGAATVASPRSMQPRRPARSPPPPPTSPPPTARPARSPSPTLPSPRRAGAGAAAESPRAARGRAALRQPGAGAGAGAGGTTTSPVSSEVLTVMTSPTALAVSAPAAAAAGGGPPDELAALAVYARQWSPAALASSNISAAVAAHGVDVVAAWGSWRRETMAADLATARCFVDSAAEVRVDACYTRYCAALHQACAHRDAHSQDLRRSRAALAATLLELDPRHLAAEAALARGEGEARISRIRAELHAWASAGDDRPNWLGALIAATAASIDRLTEPMYREVAAATQARRASLQRRLESLRLQRPALADLVARRRTTGETAMAQAGCTAAAAWCLRAARILSSPSRSSSVDACRGGCWAHRAPVAPDWPCATGSRGALAAGRGGGVTDGGLGK